MIWGENTNVEHVQNLHKCLCIGKIYCLTSKATDYLLYVHNSSADL